MSDTLRIQESVWQDEGQADFDVPDGKPRLGLRVQPATDPFGDTAALSVRAAASARHEAVYGGRVGSAVEIVAIELRSGRVYARTQDHGEAVPLAAVMDPEAGRDVALDTVGLLTAFNVDLAWQLALPPEAGHYAVFLWLDELVSPVRVVELPFAEKRPGTPAPAARAAAREAAVTLTAASPPPEDAPALFLKDISAQESGRRVRGALKLGAVRERLLAGAQQPVLNLLVLDFLTRQVGSVDVIIPEDAPSFTAFEVDVDRILAALPDAGRGRVFAVAHVNGELSPVVTLSSPGR
jgi:hypothetical protein